MLEDDQTHAKWAGSQKRKLMNESKRTLRDCCYETQSVLRLPCDQFASDFSHTMSSEDDSTPPQLDVKFSVIPETLECSFKEDFPAYDKGLVRGEPGGFVFHPHYAQNAEKIYRMNVRSDDVWIRTFPRSGIIQQTFSGTAFTFDAFL